MNYNYNHVQQIKYCQKNLDSLKTWKMTKEDNFWIEDVPSGFILVILPVSKCNVVEVFTIAYSFLLVKLRAELQKFKIWSWQVSQLHKHFQTNFYNCPRNQIQ